MKTVDTASRLFLIPGLAHCDEGVGKYTEFAFPDALPRWAEDGVAPEELVGDIKPTRDVTVDSFLGSERLGLAVDDPDLVNPLAGLCCTYAMTRTG